MSLCKILCVCVCVCVERSVYMCGGKIELQVVDRYGCDFM